METSEITVDVALEEQSRRESPRKAQEGGNAGASTPNSLNGPTAQKEKRVRGRQRIAGKSIVIEHARNAIGEIVYKGHESYYLMRNIQLGIRHSVGQITPTAPRDVALEDFSVAVKRNFPAAGTSSTPSHHSFDFKWKEYAPHAFRHLRQLFGISPEDYLMSLCGDDALRSLESPGKSGALFFSSFDQRFMIKTVPKKETKTLLRILPQYYAHMKDCPNTLLPRFYGVYRIKPYIGRKVRFIVMHNVFETYDNISYKFDLKGSTAGRYVTEQEKRRKGITFKDVDFLKRSQKIVLTHHHHTLFFGQLKRDTAFLRTVGVMDYSLLVGIVENAHTSPRTKPAQQRLPLASPHSPTSPSTNADDVNVQHVKTSVHAHEEGTPCKEVPISFPFPEDSAYRSSVFSSGVRGADGSTRYFFGIIDILLQHNLTKEIEHIFKSFKYKSDAISAVHPKKYAARLRSFLEMHIIDGGAAKEKESASLCDVQAESATVPAAPVRDGLAKPT